MRLKYNDGYIIGIPAADLDEDAIKSLSAGMRISPGEFVRRMVRSGVYREVKEIKPQKAEKPKPEEKAEAPADNGGGDK